MSKIKFTILLLILSMLIIGDVSAQTDKYEVIALRFGSRNNLIPISSAAIGATSSEEVGVCFMFWLLKGNNGRMILVDAGFTEDADAQEIVYERPDVVLKRIDINPGDITDIILTHPHWDHIGGIDLFPNAMVWMQKDDYNYFVYDAWKIGNSGGFNQKDVPKILQRNVDKKLTLVNGDNIEIIPGIRVFTGSKHTYEAQYVLVNTTTDKVIIASDNSWFYYNLVHTLPIPVTFDAKAYTNNLRRMKKMVTNVDLIIPGHDPAVFTKFPTIAHGVVKIR